MAGKNVFTSSLVKKLFTVFQFSKVEKNKFKYLGCEVEKLDTFDLFCMICNASSGIYDDIFDNRVCSSHESAAVIK